MGKDGSQMCLKRIASCNSRSSQRCVWCPNFRPLFQDYEPLPSLETTEKVDININCDSYHYITLRRQFKNTLTLI